MISIHMAIIRITIFINKVCFYVLLIIFKMLWCTTSITHMVFTIVMIIYTFILVVINLIFFFFLFYTIVPLLMIKFLFEIFFMTMSTIMIPSMTTTITKATTMTMKIYIRNIIAFTSRNGAEPVWWIS